MNNFKACLHLFVKINLFDGNFRRHVAPNDHKLRLLTQFKKETLFIEKEQETIQEFLQTLEIEHKL